jgi:mannose-6-phosphate isomerase-like protein (cupin superfamily)
MPAEGIGEDTVRGCGEVRICDRARMPSPDPPSSPDPQGVLAGIAFEIEGVRRRLEAGNGGYEVVHDSPGLEIGVYVLVAPEPDRQQPHADDEVYVVLDGSGVLEVEGNPVPLAHGSAVFVPAGVDHRFTAYEQLSVLVIFPRKRRIETKSPAADAPL